MNIGIVQSNTKMKKMFDHLLWVSVAKCPNKKLTPNRVMGIKYLISAGKKNIKANNALVVMMI